MDDHVAACPTCRAWLDGAQRVTRLVRVRPVEVPDLTARILAALQADGTVARPGPVRTAQGTGGTRRAVARAGRGAAGTGVAASGTAALAGGGFGFARTAGGPTRTGGGEPEPVWARRLRWGLGLLALVQLMVAVPGLLGEAGHDAHTGREVAALEIALSVGLLVAAFYPEYARVFAPVAVTLVVCFATISTLDMIEGAVTPDRVAVHILTVAQAVLVWQLARGRQRSTVAA